jgi:hypothetical protein
MNPGRDAPDRSYHQTADPRAGLGADPSIAFPMRWNSIRPRERRDVASSCWCGPSAKVEEICAFPKVSKEEQKFIESSIWWNKHRIMMAMWELVAAKLRSSKTAWSIDE